MGWTEEEFKRVADHTRLEEKTVAACREVLVLGVSGVVAADKYEMLPPHVSRAIKKMRETREELRATDLANAKALELMNSADGVVSLLNAAAREAAQSIKGANWIIRDSVPGQTYEGAGVVKVGGFFVQDVGRVGILHDLKNLEQEPVLGKLFEISYPREGKGSVKDISLERGTRQKDR